MKELVTTRLRLRGLSGASRVVRDRKALDGDPVLGWWMVTLDNTSSQRVCRRLGMRNLGMTERYYDGTSLRLFETTT